jgi:nitrate/TMAO reductase-like tetraheme cytochrome c subunit
MLTVAVGTRRRMGDPEHREELARPEIRQERARPFSGRLRPEEEASMPARLSTAFALAALLLTPPATPLAENLPGVIDGISSASGEECAAYESRASGYDVSSAVCGSCHERAYLEHQSSGHALAGTGEAFRAEWARSRLESGTVRQDCLACHSPTVLGAHRAASLAPELADELDLPGVTCETCHASVAWLGDEPGGGNLVACPGDARSTGRGHSRIEDFHRSSELCAACHQWQNHLGVTVLDTHREWSTSSVAEQGRQCQDCHASPTGFLVAGSPRHVGGAIAHGELVDGEVLRESAHSHEYPGSRWPAQLRAAVELTIVPLAPPPDDRTRFEVVVANVGAGHCVPTGWTALRLLWLEVDVDGEAVAAGPADPARAWDVADGTATDPAVVPPGSRLYRSVFEDLEGRPTTRAWDAAALIFDNRLRPDEERRERYESRLPAREPREIRARLRFLSRPGAWSRERGLAPAVPVLVAEASLLVDADSD